MLMIIPLEELLELSWKQLVILKQISKIYTNCTRNNEMQGYVRHAVLNPPNKT
jgi:hypothetical protein